MFLPVSTPRCKFAPRAGLTGEGVEMGFGSPYQTKWLPLLVLALMPVVLMGAADAPVWGTENYGGNRHILQVEGCRAFVIVPPQVTPDRPIPWVWYAPAIKGYPNSRLHWLFTRLIAGGVAVAGIDLGETYANPEARGRSWAFYQECRTRYSLAEKACLLAQSRGGLNHYVFAAQHPAAVRCIAGIYPVMDFRSYPGLPIAAAAHQISPEEFAARLPENNPIDLLRPLAQAGIPILHLHGDRDTLVPRDVNSRVAAERYQALGGDMTLVTVPGKGHQEVAEFFESTALLEFLLRQARTK
jgi:pimeloyl-ACP methyl ester carboxylesterase